MSIPQPIRDRVVDQLRVRTFGRQEDLAEWVALTVRDHLTNVLEHQPTAAAVLATGNSQIQFLRRLVQLGGVDWTRVTLFHMDEYLGITPDHPASFGRYMREKVESLVNPRKFHYLDGNTDLPLDECERYATLLKAQPLDLVCLGVGENGHIAFNDPPVARFDDPHWVKLVKLDEACKMQQLKEGHFPSLEAIPQYAFTLTIPALCSPKRMLCIAPEKRKSIPVRNALEGPVSTACPASILRRQPHAELFLDTDSESLLHI